MLSNDELDNGSTFILKLRNSAGNWVQWVQTLRGDLARRWYLIYRDSDWNALRAEAAAVFHDAVSETDAEVTRKSNRCVFIRPAGVTVEQLAPAGGPLTRSGVPSDPDERARTEKARAPTVLNRDQLDARLVDGDRLQLVHIGPDAEPHCQIMYREEEVPLELFNEYRNRGLLRPDGDTGVFM